MIIELIGWVGALGLLFAFSLSSFGKLDNQSSTYHLINLICAAMLIVNAYENKAYPFVVINVFWTLTSTLALLKMRKRA